MGKLVDADHIPKKKVVPMTYFLRLMLHSCILCRFDTAFYLSTLENQPPVLVEPNEVQEYLVSILSFETSIV